MTLGAAGQMIRTAGGLPVGWISSTLIKSPLVVMAPEASSMRDDVERRGSDPVEGPFRSLPLLAGPPNGGPRSRYRKVNTTGTFSAVFAI